MNDFIKNASAEMTENYNTSELFPRMNDKVLPDEKTIENIIHKTRDRKSTRLNSSHSV